MLLHQNMDHITLLLKEMLQRMYKQDFSDSETVLSDSVLKDISEISCDDRRFLDIVERRTQKEWILCYSAAIL